MRKLFLAMAFFMLTASAHAVNLQFKFDIFSSGSDIYACNAGLKHKLHSDRVCFERETLKSCNPNVCVDGEACNCVCTGGQDGSRAGEYRLDYLKASYAKWDESTAGVGPQTRVNKPAGYNNYNSIFEQGVDLKDYTTAYRKQLTSLVFALGSERYGSEYFVDICFRATQIRYPGNVGLYNLIKRRVTVTDIGSNGSHHDDFNGNNRPIYSEDKYQWLADLEVSSRVLCKDKNNRVVLDRTSPYVSFATAQDRSFRSYGTHADLKKCVVRYKFREANRWGLDSIRRWKLQHARVCTYTSVNEDE